VPQKSKFPGLGHYRIITFYWSRIKALKARMTESVGFREFYSALYRDDAEGWAKSKYALQQLKAICLKRGIDLKVVILPELHELVDYTFTKEHALITDFLQGNGIPFLDLAPFLRNEDNPQTLWVAMDDAHPNARAHRLIADYTLEFLSENNGP